MAGYSQFTVKYNGFTGAPGWMRFKFDGAVDPTQANAILVRLNNFLGPFGTYMPTGCSFHYESAVQLYDNQGELTGEITATTIPGDVTGITAGSFAGGAGATMLWSTGAVHLGGKVRGRTYFAPLATNAFTSTGQVTAGLITAAGNNAATLLAGTPKLVIWSHKLGAGGSESWLVTPATGGRLSTVPALIRSRRQ